MTQRLPVSLDSFLEVLQRPAISLLLQFSLVFSLPASFGKITVPLLALLHTFHFFNRRYKRRGHWDHLGENDVALITGGSNGLGLEMTNRLLEKKARVIVIDKEPILGIEASEQLTFYECDLNDEIQIKQTISSIKSKFQYITILINNAAIRQDQPLTDLSTTDINGILNINLKGPIYLLKEFISTNPKRLYVVTISSILGLVSPANLSIYSATKAALISLHDTLTHETNSLNIRFLLVTPGQLNTRMFKDVKPPKQYLAPVLDSSDLALKIVEKIELGERGTLHGPLYTYLIPLLRLLPYSLNEFARWFSQMDTSVQSQS